MSQAERIVVVGAGLAGLRAAERLRELGFGGELVMIGAEALPPYHRPALSKQLLTGAMRPNDLILPAYQEIGAKWRLGTTARWLSPRSRTLHLPGGEELGYDGLIIATGVEAKRPDNVPYHDQRIMVMRTLPDALNLERAIAANRGPVAVVGGGFTGCEIAASLRHLGREVTLIGRSESLLGGVLGPKLGEWLTGLHRDHGVDLALGTSVNHWQPSPDGIGLYLSDGTSLLAGCVVIAAGSEPATGWLRGSGLPLDNGVVCEATCHVVGAEDVVAAGDVAQWPNLRFDTVPRRIEHWLNAVEMGRAAAESLMAGRSTATPFTPLPRFWTEQYGIRIQAAGVPKLGTDTITLGTQSDGTGNIVGFVRAGKLMGIIGIDCPSSILTWTETIREQNPAPTDPIPTTPTPEPPTGPRHSLPKPKRTRSKRTPTQTSTPVALQTNPRLTPPSTNSRLHPADPSPRFAPAASNTRLQPAAPSARFDPAASNSRLHPAEPSARFDPAASNSRLHPAEPSARFDPAASNARLRPADPAPSNSRLHPAEPSARFDPAASNSRLHPAEPSARFDPAASNGRLRPADPPSPNGRLHPAEPSGRFGPAASNGRLRPAIPNNGFDPSPSNGRLYPADPRTRFDPPPSNGRPHPADPSARFGPAASNGRLRPAIPNNGFDPSPSNGRPHPADPSAHFDPTASNGRLHPAEPSARFGPAASNPRLRPAEPSGARRPPNNHFGTGSNGHLHPPAPNGRPNSPATNGHTETNGHGPEESNGRLRPLDINSRFRPTNSTGSTRPHQLNGHLSSPGPDSHSHPTNGHPVSTNLNGHAPAGRNGHPAANNLNGHASPPKPNGRPTNGSPTNGNGRHGSVESTGWIAPVGSDSTSWIPRIDARWVQDR